MARYTGPRRKKNRALKETIFEHKQSDRKPYFPGQHGPTLRRKDSEYAKGLREKQKLRFMFGLTEKQFRLTFDKARNMPGNTGDNFLSLLQIRLDNVVYELGLARTRSAARQFVTHGHIRVNGGKVDIPSYVCKVGDVIEVREKTSSRQLATRNTEDTQHRTAPVWLAAEPESLKGTVSRLPSSDEGDKRINLQLIVEYYSR